MTYKTKYGKEFENVYDATDCKYYEGKEKGFVICNYWECAGEPLHIWNKVCHKKCLRYIPKNDNYRY